MKAVPRRSSSSSAEHVALRQEVHPLRHAIDAAEIAAIGDRDAQIGDRAAERVEDGRNLGHGGQMRYPGPGFNSPCSERGGRLAGHGEIFIPVGAWGADAGSLPRER